MIKKCLCGYKEGEEWDDNGNITYIGDEEFIKIKSSFYIKRDESYFDKEVFLYACPKCNTVQLKI